MIHMDELQLCRLAGETMPPAATHFYPSSCSGAPCSHICCIILGFQDIFIPDWSLRAPAGRTGPRSRHAGPAQ